MVSKPAWEVIHENLNKADAAVFLITGNTGGAEGQMKEIQYCVEQGMQDKMHVISYLSKGDNTALGLPTDRIYYRVKSKIDVLHSVSSIIDNLFAGTFKK